MRRGMRPIYIYIWFENLFSTYAPGVCARAKSIQVPTHSCWPHLRFALNLCARVCAKHGVCIQICAGHASYTNLRNFNPTSGYAPAGMRRPAFQSFLPMCSGMRPPALALIVSKNMRRSMRRIIIFIYMYIWEKRTLSYICAKVCAWATFMTSKLVGPSRVFE